MSLQRAPALAISPCRRRSRRTVAAVAHRDDDVAEVEQLLQLGGGEQHRRARRRRPRGAAVDRRPPADVHPAGRLVQQQDADVVAVQGTGRRRPSAGCLRSALPTGSPSRRSSQAARSASDRAVAGSRRELDDTGRGHVAQAGREQVPARSACRRNRPSDLRSPDTNAMPRRAAPDRVAERDRVAVAAPTVAAWPPGCSPARARRTSEAPLPSWPAQRVDLRPAWAVRVKSSTPSGHPQAARSATRVGPGPRLPAAASRRARLARASA